MPRLTGYPNFLQMPEKLTPIVTELDEYRYFLCEGGRGGGKSQAIARFILYLCSRYNLRVVCGREVQISINESVYSLICDIIGAYNLHDFEIFANRVVNNTTHSQISFRGFREQGRFNIQGLEGVDILWIDESQALTKGTMDILIPTIRKDGSKIFFSMNRFMHDDPAYAFCEGRKDCLHININYDENPFCTQALKNEADECKRKSLDDYNHIWLGQPCRLAEDCVFGHEELWSAKDAEYALHDAYGLRIAGIDIARYGDDKCAFVCLEQRGTNHWSVINVIQWDNRDLAYTSGRILMESQTHRVSKAIIDEDGIGAAPLDMLNKGRNLDNFIGFRNPALSYQDNKFYGNARTANVYKLKDMILKGYIHIPQVEILKQLETAFRYTFDHNQRRILVSKEKMRKEGIKSPDLADALIMAVSLIGTLNYKTDIQYTRMPQYSKEDNLLSIAGFR